MGLGVRVRVGVGVKVRVGVRVRVGECLQLDKGLQRVVCSGAHEALCWRRLEGRRGAAQPLGR